MPSKVNLLAGLGSMLIGLGVFGVTARGAELSKPIPAHVTFTVSSGTFNASLTFNGSSQASDQFSVAVVYPAELEPDGTLAVTGPGSYQPGFPGQYHYSDSSYSVDCRGTLPVGPGASAPAATVGAQSPQTLTVQSVTAVDQSGAGYEGCQGTAPGSGLPFDGSGEAADFSGAFAPGLPDVFSARLTIPPGALWKGFYEKSVSSGHDAVAQVPASCADQFGVPEGTCQMSLTWSGTVRISADNCQRHIFSITCIGPATKDQAAHDLADMKANDDAVSATVTGLCSARPPRFRDPTNPGNQYVGPAMCAGGTLWRSSRRSDESADERVIADPPDPRYKIVAVPRVKDGRLVRRTRRALPRLAAWIHHEDLIAANLTAMTTALDRAASALGAGDTDALTRQENAVARYAASAGTLMESEGTLARAAARQLRGLRGAPSARRTAERIARLIADAKGLAARSRYGRALQAV
jgi:hypothetical protein